ncbi:Cell division control protein 25 [Termitomyces sp. J132]|nr:Cell division control protein 25 [Termitomyces sp. J132]
MATLAAPVHSNYRRSFLPQVTQTGIHTVTQIQENQLPNIQQWAFHPEVIPFFCRALYDYQGPDVSALSFKRGDIVEVLTQEPSGWWDGLLRNERGWFPSNYVEVITEKEAEQAFLVAESSAVETPLLAPSSMDNISQAIMLQIDQEANEEWLKNEVLASSKRTASANPPVRKSQMNDYWIPGVRSDGQIFYVNTQTGQHSRKIPREGDAYFANSESVGLISQLSMSPETKAGLAARRNESFKPTKDTQDVAGLKILSRPPTPEPWVRKLYGDGKSYFNSNEADGQVSPTWQEACYNTSFQEISSPLRQETTNGSNKRLSAYSDIQSRQNAYSNIPSHQNAAHRQTTDGALSKRSSEMHVRPVVPANTLPEYTAAERIAQSLQQILAPSPPESVTELATAAESVTRAVLDNIRMNSSTRMSENDFRLSDQIYDVVVVVRNLLYALAVPTLRIPRNVLPREVRDLPLPPQSPLKPAQRKVTATLSRLILSARAIQYDSGLSMTDILSRIEIDAEGLRKDVIAFILKVQELRRSSKSLALHKHPKRLHSTFNTQNVGPGLVGAGAGGRWKGFGWISLDEEQAASRRQLGSEAISQLGQALNNLDTKYQSLVHVLQISHQNSGKSVVSPLKRLSHSNLRLVKIVVEQARLSGKEFVSQISSIVSFISDIHVARHVDIDGLLQDGTGPYGRTIESAQQLVRKLEAVTQAVHDDTATFLLTLQSMPEINFPQYRQRKKNARDHLIALASALTANISVSLSTLRDLLSLGHEQAEMSLGAYNGSIEWRMSRLSFRHSFTYAEDDAHLVNMAMAFRGAPHKPPKGITPYDMSSDTGQTPGSLSRYDTTNNTPPSNDYQESKAMRCGKGKPRFDDNPVLGHLQSPAPSNGSQNLEKLLDDEYAYKIAAAKPWYLRPNYSTEEILIEPDNTVKGGTLRALVERLTAHDQIDPSFNQAFLMTFKSFMTVDELFDLLVARFKVEPPSGLKPDELEAWKTQKQQPVQLRVINTFITMLKDDGILEKEDLRILVRLEAFVSSDEVSQVQAAKKVLVYIERVVRSNDNGPKVVIQGAPPPLYPKSAKKLKLTHIDPLELARQLTLMESKLYQKINAMECLQRAREQKAENMDNIANVIQMSNRIADWVAECVLSREDARKRATIVKHLISVADRCRTLHNFSSMIAITSGLNTPPIRRLKRTWELIDRRSMMQFTACEMTIKSTKSITKYRQLMALVNPPCVPFIGVFLSALQFIHDGNSDMLPGGLVNFRKRQKAFEVITDIKRWQVQPFNLQPVYSVQTWIEESLSHFNDTKAWSEQFWALSIELEPRERDDEKMARLLQESGFL